MNVQPQRYNVTVKHSLHQHVLEQADIFLPGCFLESYTSLGGVHRSSVTESMHLKNKQQKDGSPKTTVAPGAVDSASSPNNHINHTIVHKAIHYTHTELKEESIAME